MSLITLKNVKKEYGKNQVLFENLSLEIEKGEFVGFVGKSGAGKTTLLNIIGLITDISEGTITIDGHQNLSMNGKNAMILRRYTIGYLFQNYGLIEDESVLWNLKLALEYKKVKKEFERIKKQKEKIEEQRVKVEKSKERQLNYVEKLQEIAGKSHEKDSLYKQTEARIEEICKNLEYKTYKDASKEQQRLSDEIDQMKFNKEEIEKKKESVEIQGVHIKAAIEEKENTLSSVTKQLEEHKEMNEEISDFRKFETKLHQMKKEIQKQNQNLEQLNQHISVNEQSIRFMDKKMEEYKEAEMNYTLLKDLSDTANGEQKGKTKISFERFVQSVYFDLILAAANERLSVMSEQRYYLLRKEENDINKGSSGLELEILDEWTGKRRNVRSLSGGESFKAALSLALGLSDVIQNKKGGIQVDTIFIDEGFGTLDADSLNKAMQIINSLSLEGNKLVGIISHVDELKDQIDQKIEVYKDHAGSKIKRNCKFL